MGAGESSKKVRRAEAEENVCDQVGRVISVAVIAVTCFRVATESQRGLGDPTIWIRMCTSRLQAYAFAWTMMVCIYFNPFIAFGSVEPLEKRKWLLYGADMIGLGQWVLERKKVIATCGMLPKKVDLCDAIKVRFSHFG